MLGEGIVGWVVAFDECDEPIDLRVMGIGKGLRVHFVKLICT